MRLIIKSILYFLLIPAFAMAGIPLSKISEGIPQLEAQGVLPKEQYLDVEVAKLANPKLIWVNTELLREMGFEVGERLSSAQQRELLDALAWVVPDEHITANEVTRERRKMKADFYGGDGLGLNTGSARAASAGYVQIKGVGLTKHSVTSSLDKTGRSTIHEAVKDAVWGEVLNNELPFGSNRLVAIIDRGGPLEHGESQVLEIRMDPVRAGHFTPRTYGSDSRDVLRSQKSAEFLLASLPEPSEGYRQGTSNIEKIAEGLLEYSRRLGIQYAHMNMKRLYHGATSQSNIEINGRMIDFGTASAQPGYDKVQFLEHVREFGDISEIEDTLLRSISKDLSLSRRDRQMLDSLLHRQDWGRLGAKSKMVDIFKKAYSEERAKLALQLIGLPREMIDSIYEKHRDLANQLVDTVDRETKTSKIVNLKKYPKMDDQQKTSLQKIAAIWADAGDVIENMQKSPYKYLAHRLNDLLVDAQNWALKRGVSRQELYKLIEYNSRFSNRAMSELFITSLRQYTAQANEAFLRGQLDAPAQLIDRIVTNSIREVHELKWHEAPVGITRSEKGSFKVEVFDALKGSVRVMSYGLRDKSMQKNRRPMLSGGKCTQVFL